jgi:hypothetical protein
MPEIFSKVTTLIFKLPLFLKWSITFLHYHAKFWIFSAIFTKSSVILGVVQSNIPPHPSVSSALCIKLALLFPSMLLGPYDHMSEGFLLERFIFPSNFIYHSEYDRITVHNSLEKTYYFLKISWFNFSDHSLLRFRSIPLTLAIIMLLLRLSYMELNL